MAKDIEETLKKIKNADSIKREFMLKHINSKNEQDRTMAESFKKQLDNDTSVMLETSDKVGKRIGKDGKVYGPAMIKEDTGFYEKEVPKKAKGGMISGYAKGGMVSKGNGCAIRGVKKCKMC